MKKKSTAASAFLSLRVLMALVLCVAAVCWALSGTLPATRHGEQALGKLAFLRAEAPSKVSQRTLTFAERVAHQRAIEDVYWRHRIWPKERPDTKPSLDAVMSQAQVEKKVADYLRKSQALEDYWQQSVTAERLQAEMDRMAQHTKQPEVLHELFASLGNDPFVIAECLARPILAERIIANLSGQSENRNKQFVSAQAKAFWPISMIAKGSADAVYTLPQIFVPTTCTGDIWTDTSLANAPSARDQHTAVWTGSEMVIWSGRDNAGARNTGGRYDPSTDSWTATSTTNVPDARIFHTAVWSDITNEMIVWGGTPDNVTYFNTGGRYNPSTDSWTATTLADAPSGRDHHTAVWTGSQMIVWGGYNGIYLNTGGRYEPATDSWMATTITDAPIRRRIHTAVWTGSEMIVWGGENRSNQLNRSARYYPSAGRCTTTSTVNVPDARFLHTAVWSDSTNQMIVWGGTQDQVTYFNTGGKYCAGTSSLTPTPTATPTTTGTPTTTATATPTPTPARATPTPRMIPTPRPRPTPHPSS